MSQASQEPAQALSQQTPSGEQLVPLTHPPATDWQVWPFLALHLPVASQVPAQNPVSSWLLTTVQTLSVHAWHVPVQSLRLTHPTHWLVVVSHVEAAPVQYLFAVQATHRPLAAAQAGVSDRPVQSLSLEHFVHRLAKQSGFCG